MHCLTRSLLPPVGVYFNINSSLLMTQVLPGSDPGEILIGNTRLRISHSIDKGTGAATSGSARYTTQVVISRTEQQQTGSVSMADLHDKIT